MKENTAVTTVVFAIPPQVHLLDISGPAHVFYEALDYQAPLDLKFISLLGTATATSSCRLAFAQLSDFQALSLRPKDLIFIPGLAKELLLHPDFIHQVKPFLNWLGEQYQQGVEICSVCTGAFLLAEAGLLNDRPCTTHWKYFDRFSQRFPKAQLLRNRLFVESDGIYSSAGVTSGIDLALFILEQRFGTAFASSIARELVLYFRRGETDPQLSIFLQYRNHLEDRIHTVQDYLRHHLQERNIIDSLAALIHMSPRNLTRLFKKTTGITIGQYVEKLRLERAIQLLKKGETINAIAQLCGLQSSNQLRQLFKKHLNLLPSEYLKMS